MEYSNFWIVLICYSTASAITDILEQNAQILAWS
jgi:hypothetical protein